VGGDEAVETLTEMGERHRTLRVGAAEGQVQIDERPALVGCRKQTPPAGLSAPRERDVGIGNERGNPTVQRLLGGTRGGKYQAPRAIRGLRHRMGD
jgi:hypothetical protein